MKKQIFIIIFIFAVFIFFRFYNFENRISFGWDQEQFSYQVKQLIKDHKPVLLGPRTNNDKGFFLAPYFTYLIAPFFLITSLHPWALFFFLIFYNLLFFFSSYFILKKIFNSLYALFFLSFWAINPLIVHYDFTAWWPIMIPLGVIIVWKILYWVEKNSSVFPWILLGLVLGFFINMHIQFSLIVAFTIAFIWLDRKKNNLNLAKFFSLVAAFILMFVPLLIFDIRHDFLNTKLIFNFLNNGFDAKYWDPFSWLGVFANFIHPLILIKSVPFTLFFYLLILFALIYLLKIKRNNYQIFYKSSLFLWIIFPLFFAKYGQRPSEYYFIFLYPFIYIVIISFMMTTLKKKYFLYFLLFILFLANLKNLLANLKPDYFSLKYRDNLIQNLAKVVKNKKYNLSYATPLGLASGFKYLLDYYEITPTGDWRDPLVQIKIPPDKSCQLKSGLNAIMIPPELQIK